MNRIDMTGECFGRLTVISEAGKDKFGNCLWLCNCTCGNSKIIPGYRMRDGSIKSCGCLKKDWPSAKFRKHGLRNHRLYNIWADMKQRCYNANSCRYKDYGGRGIVMYQPWVDDFKCFYDWALNNGYKDDLTIDRKDNNGNYTPENCRWVTVLTQANNKRINHNITIQNETKTLAEWCRYYDIKPTTVVARIGYGWDEVRAVITPVRRKIVNGQQAT